LIVDQGYPLLSITSTRRRLIGRRRDESTQTTACGGCARAEPGRVGIYGRGAYGRGARGTRGGAGGQITWALHFTLAPTLFEPAETPGLITPFLVLYALHDAMLKPMPGKGMAPSLAESWTMSPDGLVYEFVLRKGTRFHNGEPVTAEDVKFSFERYRGISAKALKDKVAAVET